MSLLLFGNQNSRIFKNIHWVSNCESTIGLYQNSSRINYNPDFFKYKIVVPTIEEIKNYPAHSYNFADLVDIRIHELVKLSNQISKEISILYSGGLDSTAIVVGILKNLNNQDKEKVTILCTPSSYYEFPELFLTIAKNFKVKYCCHSIEKYINDSILVTGMTNDLYFGSNGWIEKAITIDEKLPYENYEQGIKKLLEYIYPKYGNKVFNLYRPIVDESLFTIKTVSEFVYWYYFTQCYQFVRFAYLRYTNAFTSKNAFNELYQFYDDPRFEYYSLNNIGITIPYTHEQYKKPVKDYICNFLKDETYRKKGKYPSYGEVIQGNRFNYGVTENFEFLTFNESLNFFKNID